MKVHSGLLRTLMVAALLATPVGTAAQESDAKPDLETVVVTVNDMDVRLGHVIAYIERLSDDYDTVDPQTLFNGVVSQLIRELLLADLGDARFPGARFAAENAARSSTARTTASAVITGNMTEEALRRVYENRYLLTGPRSEYRASHILVGTLDEAEAIAADLRAGADFAETAKTRSTGPTGPRGGDLGWFAEGQMVKPFEDAARVLAIGEISVPVETQFGWHIIMLTGKRDMPVPPLDEVRQELEQILADGILETTITELAANADIERMDVDFDPAILRSTRLVGN
ncbi:MAG: peptidylprolyl isomerase [Paracoccaceae bacterium]|nr:peptidylprolyl isomerase [Paracoccaceae bacterium]MDE2914006.1 peptidylprolyl isomerase [Paracoccaceae bacterium]